MHMIRMCNSGTYTSHAKSKCSELNGLLILFMCSCVPLPCVCVCVCMYACVLIHRNALLRQLTANVSFQHSVSWWFFHCFPRRKLMNDNKKKKSFRLQSFHSFSKSIYFPHPFLNNWIENFSNILLKSLCWKCLTKNVLLPPIQVYKNKKNSEGIK